MDRSSAMSKLTRRRRYLSIPVSVRCSANTGWVRNCDVRRSPAGRASAASATRAVPADRRGHLGQLLLAGGLVTGDLERVGVGQVQVVAGRPGSLHRIGRPARPAHPHRVEEPARRGVQAAAAQRRGERGGPPVHPLRDGGQPVGPVVGRVHGGDDRQQHLRGADVAGRLLPPDVLLPGLQGEPVGRPAVGVHGHAHQAAGQLALEAVPDRDVAGVRTAEAHRHAEPLGGADGDVGAHLAGRPQQRQREQVGGHRRLRPALDAPPRWRAPGRARRRWPPGTAAARRTARLPAGRR